MNKLEMTPTSAEVTPTPVAVEVIPTPRASDSGRYLAYETSPDSQPGAEGRESGIGQVRSSRRFVRAALIYPTIVVAGLIGPEKLSQSYDDSRSEIKTAAATVEAEAQPEVLKGAQSYAAGKLFGTKGEVNHKVVNVEAAQAVINQPGSGVALNVNSYVSPEYVKIDANGKFFTVDGKDFSLSKRKTENGDVYIVAGRRLVEEGILKDRNHLVSLLLVGGAHNDANSDLNKDGIVTPGEVSESADRSARHNLERAFRQQNK
jgi:hypothetical protein